MKAHGELSLALIAPWRNSIAWAKSEDELVGVANAFLAQCSADSRSHLPPELRGARVENADQLVDWCLLVAADTEGSGFAFEHMALFFESAYERLPQIYRETLEGGATSPVTPSARRGTSPASTR